VKVDINSAEAEAIFNEMENAIGDASMMEESA